MKFIYLKLKMPLAVSSQCNFKPSLLYKKQKMIVLTIDIDLILIFLTLFVMAVALTYILFDVHYFVRMFVTMWWARLFQSKLKLTDTGVIYGMCTSNDVDIYWKHMNNARYVRELDFARLQFCERTGLYRAILNVNGSLLQSTTYIRYRRPILLFTPYRITTKLMYWDEKVLFFEHQFITFVDNFVCAIVISKQNCIGLNLHELICNILDRNIDEKPIKPEELDHLLECSKISSNKIRKLL